MTTPVTADSIRSLWQSMPTTPVLMSPEEMQARAGKLRRTVNVRNRREYGAAVVVVLIFGWYATFEAATPMWPAGCVLIIAAALFVAWMLHRKTTARAAPAGLSLGALIDVHRAELVRQRDALTSIWLWYLLPFAPGLVLLFADMWVGVAARNPQKLVGLIFVMFIFAALAGVLILLNLLGAAWLQRQIDDLDRYKEKP